MINTSIMGTSCIVSFHSKDGPSKNCVSGHPRKIVSKTFRGCPALSGIAGDVIMCSWGMFLKIEQ